MNTGSVSASPFIPKDCVVCHVDLGFADIVLWQAEKQGLVHARCLDWSGAPFFSALKLEAIRRCWGRLAAKTQAAALPSCQRWGELERAWPGIAGDPLAVEASIRATSGLAREVASAVSSDPAAKSALKVLG